MGLERGSTPLQKGASIPAEDVEVVRSAAAQYDDGHVDLVDTMVLQTVTVTEGIVLDLDLSKRPSGVGNPR